MYMPLLHLINLKKLRILLLILFSVLHRCYNACHTLISRLVYLRCFKSGFCISTHFLHRRVYFITDMNLIICLTLHTCINVTLLRAVAIFRGCPIPKTLIDKVDEYIPDDFLKLLDIYKVSSVPRCHFIFIFW